MTTTDSQGCAGYIQLVFFDDTTGETVTLGGAGFLTKAEDDAAWANVAAFAGESSFMADRLDANRDIVEMTSGSASRRVHLAGHRRSSRLSFFDRHGQGFFLVLLVRRASDFSARASSCLPRLSVVFDSQLAQASAASSGRRSTSKSEVLFQPIRPANLIFNGKDSGRRPCSTSLRYA
jgi:hypothetical protein